MNGSHKFGSTHSLIGVIASLAFLSLRTPALAQYTWTGPNNGSWNNGGNWSPGGGPPSTATATATFDGTSLGTANIGATVSTQSLLFSNPTGNQIITSTAGANLNSVTNITVDAAVTGVETINLANIASGSLLFPSGSNLIIANNSTAAGTTLVIGPNTVIGTPGGTGVVAVIGAGTTQISGKIGASPNNIAGALVMDGTGTLILSNANNLYGGPTLVNSGTLAVGSNGAVIPAGSDVTVLAGAVLDYGPNTNTSVLSSLYLAGTLQATGATSSDIGVTQLSMKGGTVDFGSLPYTWLHIFGTAGITTYAWASTATLIGSSNCQLLNDAGNVSMPITVAAGALNGIDLDAGLILACRSSSASFNKLGAGTMRLTNIGNTANITVNEGRLRVDDISTNGTGALGTGAITIGAATLQYGGPTATTTKNFTITGNAAIQVLTDGANLTLGGTINQSGVQPFRAYGPFIAGTSSTLTFTGNNNYSGSTTVDGNCVLAVPTLVNGSAASPIGSSSSAAGNLVLGSLGYRGTLLLTGANTTYGTDRGVTLNGAYPAGGAIGVDNNGTNLTCSGQITGTGNLIKTGPGTLTLLNQTNNYTGGTYVEAGTLSVGASGAVIPANTDVTVLAGGTFQVGFTSGTNSGAPLRTVTLDGGTMRIPAGSLGPVYYLDRLVMRPAGGTVDLAISGGEVVFSGPGAGVTVNGNSTWTGGDFQSSGVGANVATGSMEMSIAPNVTLTSHLALFNGFRIIGGGTFYAAPPPYDYIVSYTVKQGRLRADDLSITGFSSVLGRVAPDFLTLDGGALQYTGGTASTPMPIALGPAGGAVEVSNAATTLTLSGAIGPASGSVAGPLSKTGPGVLILNNLANAYVGGITVSGGRLDVSDDAQLGAAAITVNPAGTLRYTASTTTARTFTLNSGTLEAPGGVLLTLSGATVGGGFLRGAGTFAVTGGTSLTGVTTFGSTTVSQSGAASYTNFTNGGLLSITGGLADPVGMNGFSNRGSATISLGARTRINAADFETYGTLLVNPATITQDYSQTTLLTNTGTSPLNFNGGSRTFVGTPATAVFPSNWPDQSLRGTPTFVAGIDLNGKNAVVAGGLFVNNGYVEDSSNGFAGTATIVADFGSLVKGAGFFQNTVQTVNGGKFQAGNSPGSATFGQFVLGPGGVSSYVFAIDDATGAAGPTPDAAGHVSGWGLVKIGAPPVTHAGLNTNGDFVWTATPADKLTVSLQTLLNPTTIGVDVFGMMDHFDPNHIYSWPAVEWTGSYAGPMDVAILDEATAFDTTGFANSFAGTFGWSLDTGGHTLSLTYTPTAVPEPGTLALVGLAAAGLAWRRRRSVKHCHLVLSAAVVTLLAWAGPPAAAQYTWTGDFFGVWDQALNWSPNGIPNSPTATASFTGNALGTVNIFSNVSTKSLLFSNPTGNYTVTSSAGVSLSSVSSITVDAAVTGTETVNLAYASTGSLLINANTDLTITNNSTAAGTSMFIGPNTVIGTSGTGGVYVTGAGTTEISGSFAGSPNRVFGGVTMDGAGTLILSNANNGYTGYTTVFRGGTLAVPSVAPFGLPSPIGLSTSNLRLGDTGSRGTLLLTGTKPTYTLDRTVYLGGDSDELYFRYGAGGAIGVQNAGTTLTMSGKLTPLGHGGALIKTGPGTLSLTNTSNDYNAGTYVEGGTLDVGASGAVIPANTDVTVFSGAILRIGFTTDYNTPIGKLTLNGGTLSIPAGYPHYYMNRLVTGPTGGTIDVGSTGYPALIGTGAGATINGNSTLTGSGSVGIDASSGGSADLTIVPNVALTAYVALSGTFRILGGGTLYTSVPPNGNSASYTVSQGRLRADDLSVNANYSVLGYVRPGFLTLDGGILQYTGPTASTPMPIALGAAGGAVEVSNATTTLTVTGAISGFGLLTKTGPGVLILNNTANNYAAGITVSGGRLEVADDAQLGSANLTVNALGTLRYTADSITARTFTLNAGALETPSGVTLTLDGAAVGGGFLRGPGTFAVTGGTTLSGATTFASTAVTVTGPASFVNFTNGGPFNVAAGLASPVTMNGFTNKVGGQVTVGAASSVTAADFESYGTLSISPATVTQDFSQTTLMTNVGVSPLNFGGGSRTFVGTPATAVFPNTWPDVSLQGTPTFVAGIDLNGKNAVVAGGLFVNNGYVEDSSNGFAGTATIVADFGSLVKGAGFFQNTVLTQNGGKFQAGNSPGSATFGKFVLGPGGVSSYVFAIDDATGSAGPTPDALGHVSGWGLVKAIGHMIGARATTGDFTWTATPADKLLVSLQTLINPTTVGVDVAGLMDHFDPTQSYAWPAVEWTGSYAGPADATTLDSSTAFDTRGFTNPIAGTFGWSLDAAGQTLSLTYTPSAVPEPGTFGLVAAAALGLAVRRRGSQRNGDASR